MRAGFALFTVVLGLGCEEPREPEIPAIVTDPMADHQPPSTDTRAPTTDHRSPTADERPPTADDRPPPWPTIEVIQGRFSPAFAREYVELVRAERAAFDAEMQNPPPPAKTPREAAHRRISEKGRRARLMNKPTLMTITDDEISDVLSFNPQMSSGEEEFARLLREHPQALSTCVDHGRWLLYGKHRQDALAEYMRCARLPGITEDQLRYVQTQIAAARNMKD